MDFKADFESEEPTLTRKELGCFRSRRPHPLWSSLPWRDPRTQTRSGRPVSPPHSPGHQQRPSAAIQADMGLAQAGTTLQKESLFGRLLALGALLLSGVSRWKTCSWAAASAQPFPADTSTLVQSPHHQAEVKLLTRCSGRCAPSVEGPVLCALAGMKGKSVSPGPTPRLCVSGCKQSGGLCHVGRSQVRTALSGL